MKTLLISIMILAASVADAQITIAEPEFEQEAVIVKNNTTGTNLKLEYAKQKRTEDYGTTAVLFGEGDQSQYYEFAREKSPVTLTNDSYDKDLQLILSWSDNKLSPQRLIQIIPLEIQKNKRIYNLGDYDVVTKSETFDEPTCIDFSAVKYGTRSYLITIPKSELQKLRCGNQEEVKKYGKQYLIHIKEPASDRVSANECFLTFGIEQPSPSQLNLMNNLDKKAQK